MAAAMGVKDIVISSLSGPMLARYAQPIALTTFS